MTANIFGERFLGRNKPAWHNLGRVFTAPIGALEAVEAAGMDYLVNKVEVAMRVVAAPGWEAIPGKFSLVREPTHDDPVNRHFGFVGEPYRVVQNTEVAKAIDPLTQLWPVETAGALDHGRTLFLILDAGSGSVGGEEVHQYFLVVDTKDGGTSMRLAFTPVRIVCYNTLVTGLREATTTARLSHHQSVADDLDFRVHLLNQLQQSANVTMQEFERMASAVLTVDQVQHVMEAAYPIKPPGKKYSLAQELFASTLDTSEYADSAMVELTGAGDRYNASVVRQGELRAATADSLNKMNDANPALANTAWYTYNAVAEVEDWREGKGAVDRDVVFGHRANTKARAFGAARSLVK